MFSESELDHDVPAGLGPDRLRRQRTVLGAGGDPQLLRFSLTADL